MAEILPVPARAEMKELTHAALAHAQQQLDRGQLLLNNRDWPGAYATATLAFEEVGKAMLCAIGMGVPTQFQVNDWFWPAFNTHKSKITIARVVLTLLTATGTPSQPVVQAIEDLGVVAVADHQTKMRALYVDCKDGSVLQPADVGEQDARDMIANVRTCLDVLALFNNADRASEVETLMAVTATAIETLIDSPDIDWVVRAWHKLRGRSLSAVDANGAAEIFRPEGALPTQWLSMLHELPLRSSNSSGI